MNSQTIRHFLKHRKLTFGYKPSRLHEQLLKKSKEFDSQRKQELYYNMGIYGIVFALCWATIPFYKLFCQHFGLEGDLNQKDYSQVQKGNLSVHRKFRLVFKAEMDPKAKWDFEPVQDQVLVHAGETALVFYKAYNKEEIPIVGFSTYQIFPEDASLYFAKIQCFCFNQQLLNPKEELLLPILFYLEPEINDDPHLKDTQEITIQYRFFKSKKQDLAQMVDEELKRIKRNKMILMRMRSAESMDDEKFNEIKNAEIQDDQLEDFSEYEYEQTLAASQK